MKISGLILLMSTFFLAGCSRLIVDNSDPASATNSNQSTKNETPETINDLSELELPKDYIPYSERTIEYFDYVIFDGTIKSYAWTMDDQKKPLDIVISEKAYFWALKFDQDNNGYKNVVSMDVRITGGYDQAYYYLGGNSYQSVILWSNFWDMVYNAKHNNTENTNVSSLSTIPYNCLKYNDRYELVCKDLKALFSEFRNEEAIPPTDKGLEMVLTFSLSGDLIHFKVPMGAFNGNDPFNDDYHYCHIYQCDFDINRISEDKYVAPTYTISYELDGGRNDSRNPSLYTFGQKTELYEPTKEGYQFISWEIDCRSMFPEGINDYGYEECEYIPYIPSGFSGNLTLHAVWEQQ